MKFVLIVFALFFVISANAEDFPIDQLDSLPSVESYDGKFQLADEIELEAASLTRIVKYFDFTEIQERVISLDAEYPKYWMMSRSDARAFSIDELAVLIEQKLVSNKRALRLLSLPDNYLFSDEALKNLDPDFRAKLTQGLNLGDVSLLESDLKVELATKVTTIQNSAQDDFVKKRGEAQYELRNGVLVDPRRAQTFDWETLHQRWNALPFDTKMKYINFNYISAQKRAFLLMDYPVYFKLKDEAPVELHKILENKTTELESNEVFEYKPTTQGLYSNGQDYLEQVLLSAKLTHNTRSINNPMKFPDGGMAVHLNISKSSGESISVEFARALSHLFVVHTYERNLDILERILILKNNHVGYRVETSKALKGALLDFYWGRAHFGLLALQGKRLEVRYHYLPPEEELKLLMYYLSLPEEESLKLIYDEIAAKINLDLITQIMKVNSPIRGLSLYLDVKKYSQREVPFSFKNVLQLYEEYEVRAKGRSSYRQDTMDDIENKIPDRKLVEVITSNMNEAEVLESFKVSSSMSEAEIQFKVRLIVAFLKAEYDELNRKRIGKTILYKRVTERLKSFVAKLDLSDSEKVKVLMSVEGIEPLILDISIEGKIVFYNEVVGKIEPRALVSSLPGLWNQSLQQESYSQFVSFLSVLFYRPDVMTEALSSLEHKELLSKFRENYYSLKKGAVRIAYEYALSSDSLESNKHLSKMLQVYRDVHGDMAYSALLAEFKLKKVHFLLKKQMEKISCFKVLTTNK